MMNDPTPVMTPPEASARPKPNGERKDALLLVVDDREDNRSTITEVFEREGYPVLTASCGRQALQQIADHGPDAVVLDLKMPDLDGLEVLKTARTGANPPEIILLTAYGTVETAVEALKHGAFNYLTKPVNLRDLRAQVEKALEHRNMHKEVTRLRHQIRTSSPFDRQGELIFESRPMRDLLEMVRRLGTTHSNVLIQGESGSGKEVIAQALHQSSSDTQNPPFVAVHCAALPESLLESELFGYEKGAFTGADSQHIGRLEMADGGTLFLDEIGEIPPSMQVKLLRVLEQRELTRVGGRHVIKVNFRLIAATNADLEESVRRGLFREDLYYRLNVVRLVVPALRERTEDIIPMFRSFLRRFSLEQGVAPPELTMPVESALLHYAWPGNVRELRNLAERLSIFAAGRALQLHDLPAELRDPLQYENPGRAPDHAAAADASEDTLDLQEIERRTILKALDRRGGNRSAAAAGRPEI